MSRNGSLFCRHIVGLYSRNSDQDLNPSHPIDADLNPGEIIVCPATDPAWKPLILSAGGLVMEVAGMMPHGAIVARECGIPAVVGTNRATSRLKLGQRIKLIGSTGEIDHMDN